jgi:hypothetical protein
MAYCKVLTPKLSGQVEEDHEKSLSKLVVPRLKPTVSDTLKNIYILT